MRVTLLAVAVASLTACGSTMSTPTQFARLVVRWSSAGDYDAVYDNLYAAQRRAISRKEYVDCARGSRRVVRAVGVDLATVEIEATMPSMTRRISVPSTHTNVRATVVQFRVSVSVRGKRRRVASVGKVFLAHVDGRWRYIDGLGNPYVGPQCLASETLGSDLLAKVPSWVKKQGFADNHDAVEGAKLFAVSGCLNCHSYLGTGGGFVGAPDLTAEGSKGKGIPFQIAHLQCPSCVDPGSPMPPFEALGPTNLRRLAAFLEASKG